VATEKPESIDLSYSRYIPAHPMGYLDSRGIGPESVARFELGWDADSMRVVIPAKDQRGTLRFLIKRAIREKDWPKYLYTEGFPKTSLLFGACDLDLEAVQSLGLVLVEGSLDVIKLHQHGFRNAAAILGTGISEKQAAIVSRIKPRRVVMMFDRDSAGWRNMQSCERRLKTFPLFTCLYPKGKSDPAELSRKEVERAVDRAISMVEFKARIPRSMKKVTAI
jgi:DNA primase